MKRALNGFVLAGGIGLVTWLAIGQPSTPRQPAWQYQVDWCSPNDLELLVMQRTRNEDWELVPVSFSWAVKPGKNAVLFRKPR
jgi:hypothetical protein